MSPDGSHDDRRDALEQELTRVTEVPQEIDKASYETLQTLIKMGVSLNSAALFAIPAEVSLLNADAQPIAIRLAISAFAFTIGLLSCWGAVWTLLSMFHLRAGGLMQTRKAAALRFHAGFDPPDKAGLEKSAFRRPAAGRSCRLLVEPTAGTAQSEHWAGVFSAMPHRLAAESQGPAEHVRMRLQLKAGGSQHPLDHPGNNQGVQKLSDAGFARCGLRVAPFSSVHQTKTPTRGQIRVGL